MAPTWDEGLMRFALGAADVALCPRSHGLPLAELEARLPESVAAAGRELKKAQRRLEFLTGRLLYEQLTGEAEPLLRGEKGMPAWPEGLRGSITHKDGHVAFAFSRDPGVWGIGLDLEDISRMNLALEPKICNAGESVLLGHAVAMSGMDRAALLAVIFSFKEALFKAHFPLGQKFFYFHEAQVTDIDCQKQLVSAELLIYSSPRSPRGSHAQGAFQWLDLEEKRYVLTALVEEAR